MITLDNIKEIMKDDAPKILDWGIIFKSTKGNKPMLYCPNETINNCHCLYDNLGFLKNLVFDNTRLKITTSGEYDFISPDIKHKYKLVPSKGHKVVISNKKDTLPYTDGRKYFSSRQTNGGGHKLYVYASNVKIDDQTT